MNLSQSFISKIIILFSFSILFLFSSCSSSKGEEASGTEAVKYRFTEERSALAEVPFSYQDFSPKYGVLQSYDIGQNEDAVFLYQKELSQSNSYEHHIIYYENETHAYRELFLETENKVLDDVALSPNGIILLFYTGRSCLYRPGEVTSYADFPADSRGGFLFTKDDQIICKAHISSPYYYFDLNTGSSCGEYLSSDFLYHTIKNYNTLLSDNGSSFLLVTGAGLFEKTEADEWVLMVPSEKTSMYKPDFTPCKVWKEQDKYYISDTSLTYCYSRTPIPANEEETLLKIVSLQENPFIKESIINYQIEHPEITIKYEFLSGDPPENVQEYNTQIQKINAQLVSEQAGDIYMLDYLPWQSYQEKGYLADLTELLSPFLASSDYFTNIMQGMADESGLYTVPLHFDADGIYCRSDFIPYVKSLSALASYLQENPSLMGLAPYYYDSDIKAFFFPMLYHFYGHELYENGVVTEERLRSYLTSTKVLYDRMKQGSQAAHFPYQEKYHSSNYYVMSDMWQVVGMQAGNLSLYISGERNLCFWPQTTHFEGYEIAGTGYYHPTMLFGLHIRASDNPEAKKLFQYLVLCTNFYNCKKGLMCNRIGIPVYKPAISMWLENWLTLNKDLPNDYYLDSEYGESFPIYLPVKQDADSCISYLDTFHTPGRDANSMTDPVYAIMEENIDGYYEGTKSLEQTTDAIYKSVKLIQN